VNRDKIISLTNKLSCILVIILLYWVFIFIYISVFGFKVFRENLTELFFISILAILALLTGAVIINIMLNLTKISQSLAGEKETTGKMKAGKGKVFTLLFVLSFPLIFGLLYLGDLRSSHLKREYLLSSAQAIVTENQEIIEKLGEYKYDSSYLRLAESSLNFLEKQDKNFRSLSLIVEDTVQGKNAFLRISSYIRDTLPKKATLVHTCSKEEREYLKKVFSGESDDYRFSSHDGRYELYYPVKTKNRIIVLYFYDYQYYGKIGS